jgi:hypothetical protein
VGLLNDTFKKEEIVDKNKSRQTIDRERRERMKPDSKKR